MGAQQLIANSSNIITGAAISASAVLASTEIKRTAMTRSGTGIASITGSYTGDDDATYQLVYHADAAQPGAASAPMFSGVGSGTLEIQTANIPAQEVSVTLLTPADPGSCAECAIGPDALKAVTIGASGNGIQIEVDRSGLTATASGHATLEAIAADADELTAALWNISGVITTTDLSSNVPVDAPRIRFGSDPAIYRVVRDYSSGSATVTLSPAAVREIPLGTPINIITETYDVTVTGVGMGTGGADIVESYELIITGYDLLRALMGSELIRPAYTPSPITTIGGNAVTDLPIITGAYAVITGECSADIRPADLSARSTAPAETITIQSKGNGAWAVSGTVSGALQDATEGSCYTPPDSPVLFTIPKKKAAATTTSVEAVSITDIDYADREDADAGLPAICIQGKLGINAKITSITAVYTQRPNSAGCYCPTKSARFSKACLGLTLTQEDDMALDPAYQSRLLSLYTWQKNVININADVVDLTGPGTITKVNEYVGHSVQTGTEPGPFGTQVPVYEYEWIATGKVYASESSAQLARGEAWKGATEENIDVDNSVQLTYACGIGASGSYAGIVVIKATTVADIEGIDGNDILLCNTVTDYLADCLALIYTSTPGLAAWDALFATTQTELAKLDDIKLIVSAPGAYLSGFEAGCDVVLVTAGIVPGEPEAASGLASTGCWQNDRSAAYWWILSGGYAPAFTGKKYYSSTFGTLENTKEFGFEIQCTCPELLLPGDTLTIQIGAGLSDNCWSSNNSFTIATIPASPLAATGGKNADDSETWAVSGTGTTGPLPDFTATSTVRTYNSDGLSFALAAGGIPFSVGDKFRFSVQRGHYTWFKNDVEMGTGSLTGETPLDEGLSAAWTSGIAPAFVDGDSFSFLAQQPHAASGVATPNDAAWRWTGSGSLTVMLPAAKSIHSIALWHNLSNITIETTSDGTTWAALPWDDTTLRSPLVVMSGDALTITGLRINSTASGSLRWLWAGIPFAPEYSGAVKMRHMFDITRARTSGASAMLGEGTGATIEWDVLTPNDADTLITMVRGVKIGGDETIIMIPQRNNPDEAFLCRIDSDSLELSDIFEFQPDDTSQRIISASLELVPEWL